MAESTREYINHLLESLHKSNLGWIAEEIKAEIASGRMVEKSIEGGRLKSGLTVEEFTDNEQLAIAMRIVLERAQVGYALWSETVNLLHRRLGIQAVDYVEVEGERSSRFEPFLAGFDRTVDDLARVFSKVASECTLRGDDDDLTRLSARPFRLNWGDQ